MNNKSFLKKHPKLAIVFFNLFCLFLIFIIFEIVLRLFTPAWLKYTMNYLKTGNGFRHASDANWKITYKNGDFYSFTPGSTFKIYHAEYENTAHINNLGGRNTIPNEIADSNNIIPFTGDSFVIGVGVEDTENIVSIAKKNMGLNFLNLGVTGSCLPNQRKIIDTRYSDLGKPPVVIFGFFLGNDFNDIRNVHLKIKTSAGPDTSLTDDNPLVSKNSFAWKVNNFINHNAILKRSYVLQYIKQKIRNIKNKDKDKDFDHMDPVFHILDTRNTAFIQQARILLDKEIDSLSKEPYKSIVILIPDRNQVDASIRKSMCSYYNLDEKSLALLLPNQILIEALNKYHIKYIDPTQCIIKYAQAGKLYYTQDNHFTKLGQATISNCIQQELKSDLDQLGITKN